MPQIVPENFNFEIMNSALDSLAVGSKSHLKSQRSTSVSACSSSALLCLRLFQLCGQLYLLCVRKPVDVGIGGLRINSQGFQSLLSVYGTLSTYIVRVEVLIWEQALLSFECPITPQYFKAF